MNEVSDKALRAKQRRERSVTMKRISVLALVLGLVAVTGSVVAAEGDYTFRICLLYTSPSPRD